jgi:hypothetical protein
MKVIICIEISDNIFDYPFLIFRKISKILEDGCQIDYHNFSDEDKEELKDVLLGDDYLEDNDRSKVLIVGECEFHCELQNDIEQIGCGDFKFILENKDIDLICRNDYKSGVIMFNKLMNNGNYEIKIGFKELETLKSLLDRLKEELRIPDKNYELTIIDAH